MNSVNTVVLGSITILLTLSLTKCQLDSPCPNVFEYQYSIVNNVNQLYGAIRAPLEDSGSVIKLEVQISLGNPVQGYNGNIQLGAPRADIIQDLLHNRPLRYLLYFPPWFNIIPKVTRILINGKEICAGNPVDRGLVPVVTTVNLQHSLTVTNVNGLNANDNWRPLPNSIGSSQKVSNGQPNLYFTLGSPNNQESSNLNLQNPFTATKPHGFDGLFNLGQFAIPNQNNIFSTNNPPFWMPNNNQGPIPAIPNKSGTESSSDNGLNYKPAADSNAVSQSVSDVCGISVNSNALLINGNRFSRHLHPWLAALFLQNEEGLKFMCGSTLISSRHVVTAAHCIHSRRKKFNPEELWTVLGRDNIQKWSNDGAQIIQAQSTHFYPDHQFHTADADIGIIVLNEEVVFTNLVRPICLWSGNPDENLIVGEKGTVLGWGKDEQGRAFTSQPRLVTMPVVSEEACLRSNIGFREITSNRTFCAGNRDASGPCNGDSGSGFLIKRLERWHLRGIVSMSLLGPDGNCDLRQYIVFTDVAKYANWIRGFLRSAK